MTTKKAEEKEPGKDVPKEKPKKVEQNGVVRPRATTKTGRVWEISDELSAAKGSPALRKDVLAKATEEGINPATAATQYGRWRKFNGLEGRGTDGPDDSTE